MSNGNPPRRSRKSEEPQTIDLEAERIVTSSDEAAKSEATVEAATASEAPAETTIV